MCPDNYWLNEKDVKVCERTLCVHDGKTQCVCDFSSVGAADDDRHQCGNYRFT